METQKMRHATSASKLKSVILRQSVIFTAVKPFITVDVYNFSMNFFFVSGRTKPTVFKIKFWTFLCSRRLDPMTSLIHPMTSLASGDTLDQFRFI